jgi:Cys-tRNA(Pro)/Cys-tRNA(Cys) deacylase
VIDASAERFESIMFSGGKIGYQVEVSLSDLSKVVRYTFFDVTK